MHGIHVHGDPRGPCVIARVDQHTGNCSVIEFPASHYAVIAAEYLVHALRASTHHDGRDESVALDGLLEALHLGLGEILRVTTQSHQTSQFERDEFGFDLQNSTRVLRYFLR